MFHRICKKRDPKTKRIKTTKYLKMEIWKADPTFTNFVPKTAVEAVDRFTRCQRNGLRPMLVPESLISCAKGLDEAQLDLFEAWIINPNGSLDGVELV